MKGKRIATGAGLSVGAAFALAAPAQAAADIVVDTTADTAPDPVATNGCDSTGDSNLCTLREGIQKANNDAGQDQITFASSITGSAATIDIHTLGQMNVTEGLHIAGPAAKTISVSGADSSRILDVNMAAAGQFLVIDDLNLVHGKGNYGGAIYVHNPNPATLNFTDGSLSDNTSTGAGGAVYSYGSVSINDATVSDNQNLPGNLNGGAISASGLTVFRSTFSGNYSGKAGGAIVASGDIDIDQATFDQNNSDGNGGAIQTTGGGVHTQTISNSTFTGNGGNYGGAIRHEDSNDLTISSSTFSANHAAEAGGAIHAQYSSLTVLNSTISGNQAGSSGHSGGGIYSYGVGGDQLTVRDSTVTNNSGYLGGGITLVDRGGVPNATLESTIVAGNIRTSINPGNTDLVGAFDGSFNLVQNLGTAALAGGSNILGQDPQLGPLANNGGLTQTRKPGPASPVIDKGGAFGLTTDQRGSGFARTFDVGFLPNAGDGTDIGAVELQASEAPPAPPPPGTQKKKCKKKKKAKKHSASAAKKKCKKKKKH
jgi:predicted outer membrane repeat protein